MKQNEIMLAVVVEVDEATGEVKTFADTLKRDVHDAAKKTERDLSVVEERSRGVGREFSTAKSKAESVGRALGTLGDHGPPALSSIMRAASGLLTGGLGPLGLALAGISLALEVFAEKSREAAAAMEEIEDRSQASYERLRQLQREIVAARGGPSVAEQTVEDSLSKTRAEIERLTGSGSEIGKTRESIRTMQDQIARAGLSMATTPEGQQIVANLERSIEHAKERLQRLRRPIDALRRVEENERGILASLQELERIRKANKGKLEDRVAQVSGGVLGGSGGTGGTAAERAERKAIERRERALARNAEQRAEADRRLHAERTGQNLELLRQIDRVTAAERALAEVKEKAQGSSSLLALDELRVARDTLTTERHKLRTLREQLEIEERRTAEKRKQSTAGGSPSPGRGGASTGSQVAAWERARSATHERERAEALRTERERFESMRREFEERERRIRENARLFTRTLAGTFNESIWGGDLKEGILAFSQQLGKHVTQELAEAFMARLGVESAFESLFSGLAGITGGIAGTGGGVGAALDAGIAAGDPSATGSALVDMMAMGGKGATAQNVYVVNDLSGHADGMVANLKASGARAIVSRANGGGVGAGFIPPKRTG